MARFIAMSLLNLLMGMVSANLLHADDGINSTVTFNISGKVIVDGYTTQANTKVVPLNLP